METVKINCDCHSPYQDQRYGKQQRVHNVQPGTNPPKAQCTVCGKQVDYQRTIRVVPG